MVAWGNIRQALALALSKVFQFVGQPWAGCGTQIYLWKSLLSTIFCAMFMQIPPVVYPLFVALLSCSFGSLLFGAAIRCFPPVVKLIQYHIDFPFGVFVGALVDLWLAGSILYITH